MQKLAMQILPAVYQLARKVDFSQNSTCNILIKFSVIYVEQAIYIYLKNWFLYFDSP